MDDDSTPKAGASTMVPVAIGLVGVVLAAAALFLSLGNRGAAKSIDDLKQDLASAQAQAQAAEKHAADLDGKFSALVQTNSALSTQIQNVTGQVNDALNKMGAAITDDRQQLKVQADAIQQLSAKPSTTTATTTASSDKTAAAPATSTAVPGQGGIHVIATGDTLGSLAHKYGVSVSAIEAANPDANPTKLHLGQKITIPPAPASSAAPAGSTTPPAAAPASAPAST
jgi:LysM repeat protein